MKCIVNSGQSLKHPRNLWLSETNKDERKVMNNKFDELAKGLAQSVTRRQALKRFSVGLAGMALASFGLANKAQAEAVAKKCAGPCERCGFGLQPCCKGSVCDRNYLCVAPGISCGI